MITTEKKVVATLNRSYAPVRAVGEMISSYKNDRWKNNCDQLGRTDSLTVWQSLEELEHFVATAKAHGADGVKFCFATFNEKTAAKPEHVGLQTVIQIATRSTKGISGNVNKEIYSSSNTGEMNVVGFIIGWPCPPSCSVALNGESELGKLGTTLIDRGEQGMSVI